MGQQSMSWPPQTKENKKVIFSFLGYPHQWERNPTREEKEKFFKKMSFNKQRGEKYKRKYYNKLNPKRHRFFREAAYCPIGKNNCECWACKEAGHYANEYNNRNNNKLIEILKSLDYFEISE